METLRALLFPLSWSSCFVSPLPDALSGLLEAPGGFMIGFHVSEDLLEDTTVSDISIRLAMGESLLYQQAWKRSLAIGTYIVDLSADSIFKHVNSERDELISYSEKNEILKSMPFGPRKRLQTKLHNIVTTHDIGPNSEGGQAANEKFDSAFDFQNPSGASSPRSSRQIPTLEIRDALMVFMIDLLGDYTTFIRPPSRDLQGDTFRTFQEGFAVDDYLAHADTSMKQILGLLLETQMFSVLLQQRSEGGQYCLSFYEKAAQLYRELGLSAGGHGDKISSITGHPIPEIPMPFFKIFGAHMIYEKRFGYWNPEEHVSHPSNTKSTITSSISMSQHSLSPTNNLSISQKFRMSTSIEPPAAKNSATQMTKQRREYLAVLLDYYSTSYEKFAKVYDWIDDSAYHEAQISDTPAARDELDKGFDLELFNPSLGPLVIPGPIKAASQMKELIAQSHLECKDVHIDHDGRFSYQESWPMMNDLFLDMSSDAIHPRVQHLRALSNISQSKVTDNYRDIVRSPAERFAMDLSLLSDSSSNGFGMRAYVDTQHLQSVLVDLTSTSIMLLVCRSMYQSKVNHDILQVVGLFSQLEGVGLLHAVDECTWRAALLGCSLSSTEITKRLACILFDTLQLFYRHPDVLSFGRFMDPLSQKNASTNADVSLDNEPSYRDSDVLDPYFYLEEIGSSWFFDQRIALLSMTTDQRQQRIIRNNSSERHSGSIYRIGDVVNIASAQQQSLSKVSSANLDSARIISEQLSLVKTSSSLLSFYHPRNPPPLAIPKHPLELVPSRDEEESSAVMSTVIAMRSRSREITNDINASRDMPASYEGSYRSRQDSSTESSTPPHRSRVSSGNNADFASRSPNSPLSSAAASAAAASLGKMISGSLKLGYEGTSTIISVTANGMTHIGNQSKSFQFSSGRDSNVSRTLDRMSMSSTSSWMSSSKWLGNRSSASPKRSDSGDKTLPSSSNAIATTNSDGRRVSVDGYFLDDDESDSEDPELSGGTANGTKSPTDDNAAIKTTIQAAVMDASINAFPVKIDLSSSSPSSIIQRINDLLAKDLGRNHENNGSIPAQAIGIHSQSKCPSCNHAMLDEEILTTWFGYSSTVKSSSPRSRRRSIRAMHQASCPSCGEFLVPRLHIRCYQLDSAAESSLEKDRNLSEAANAISLVWQEDVEYYSPFGLRAGYEDAIMRVGNLIANPRFMHRFYPELFWNLIWYMNRAALPTGFLPWSSSMKAFFAFGNMIPDSMKDDDVFLSEIHRERKERYSNRVSLREEHAHMRWLLGPMIVGWRENLVRAKIGRLLHPTAIDSSLKDLAIADLFPSLSIDEESKLVSIAHNMEDLSWTGMRESILDMTSLANANPKLMEAFDCGTESFGRYLYLSLFHLAVVMKKDKILQPHVSESQVIAKVRLSAYLVSYDRCS
jgi:hypothetical protein